ncbi:OmpH family outer membrane protein [Geminicoccaceae bacterium 1502E]|nr:OmpH family outer membrane protein [Geminicoccaceae bacterium 1502E]
MRTTRTVRALVLAAVLGAAMPVADAQQLAPTVAVVVDYQRILRDAKAARSIREQIEERRERYLGQLSQEEQRLHEADRELARQRSVLSTEVFAERRREFEQQVLEVQRLTQERRRELESVSTAALNEVRQAVIEVTGKLADTRGFNIVLPSSGVLLFAPEIDLTDEVLALLDKRLPNVRVPEKAE